MNAYIISSIEDLDQIRESWKDLFRRSQSDNPFLTWEWNREWIGTFAASEGINVVVVEDQGLVVAIAPFYLDKSNVLFLADSLFADYMDVLSDRPSEDLFDRIFALLAEKVRWSKMALRTIPGTSANTLLIERVLKQQTHFAECRCIHENPYVDSTGDFDAYVQNRSKGIKKELRRTKNRLAKDCSDWEFFEAKTPEEKDSVFDKLIEFHLQRQTDKVGTSIFGTEENRAFYRNFVKIDDAPWSPHVAGISMDGRLVTASISLICGRVFYYWITSFDNSLGGGSVGNYHVKLLLEKCFREDIDRMDFMGGTEAYKLRWADVTYDNFEVRAYRSRVKKIRDDAWIKMRSGMKSIKDNSEISSSVWTKLSKYIGK
ncbi:hypothetical protein BVY04_00980 [bacterium M21]|nr:hypothetical protein BVY04_00980 [bacterium M21]